MVKFEFEFRTELNHSLAWKAEIMEFCTYHTAANGATSRVGLILMSSPVLIFRASGNGDRENGSIGELIPLVLWKILRSWRLDKDRKFSAVAEGSVPELRYGLELKARKYSHKPIGHSG